MFKKFLLISSMIAVSMLYPSDLAASIGVSPPYVKSDKIRPGGRYEQTVNILRSDPRTDLPVEISVEAIELINWISFVPGRSFILPAGEFSVPFTVRIDFPPDANIGSYQGKLVVAAAASPAAEGMIGIRTGAEIIIDIDVTDQVIREFAVKDLRMEDHEFPAGILARWPLVSRWWPLRARIKVENTGNVKLAPDKVEIEIYDISQSRLLLQAETRRLRAIEPFRTEEIKADFPVRIEAGQYWARINVYKGQNAVYGATVAFSAQASDSRDRLLAALALILLVLALFVLAVCRYRRLNRWAK